MDKLEEDYYHQIGHFVGTRITAAKGLLEEDESSNRERIILLNSLKELSSSDYLYELISYLENHPWNTLSDVSTFDSWYSSRDPLIKFSDDEGLLSRLD